MLNKQSITPKAFDAIDEEAVTTLRMLSLDAIANAKSGHPGLPLGASPMAYVLFSRHLTVDPQHPDWANRDRFVLSAGHGSAMLYSLLHLAGFDVSVGDLQGFRQLGSRTPGHPEVEVTPGIDATTGPLGQGVAMATGMAMAETHLASQYNRDHFDIMDHYTYVICGDGDLMEGVASEAASLAGEQQLNKLIVLYDSNNISLDGPLQNASRDNVAERFQSYGWHYLKVEDGNDLAAIDDAITTAEQQSGGPTLIEVKTIIGVGSPNQGTNKVHGAPIVGDALAETRKFYGWDRAPFDVPSEVIDRFQATLGERGKNAFSDWQESWRQFSEQQVDLAADFDAAFGNVLPEDFAKSMPLYDADNAVASRQSGHDVLQQLSQNVPTLWGGSADLFSSNKTQVDNAGRFSPENRGGRNIWFGVREFAEGAIMNGIALHGGSRVYGSTFFVFSDYMKPAIRLAAIQHLPVIYVFTHDSVAVGEDGPTHEPIEQLAALRAIPGLSVIRPADGNETVAAWKTALATTDKPTAIILSRQTLPTLPESAHAANDGVDHGGYVVMSADKATADGLLIATGSEVNLAVAAKRQLATEGIDVAVVSMPSFDRFNAQNDDYKKSVLPKTVRKRLGIEMASDFGWGQYVGLDGRVMSIDRFGESGNGQAVIDYFGFTVDHVVAAFKALSD